MPPYEAERVAVLTAHAGFCVRHGVAREHAVAQLVARASVPGPGASGLSVLRTDLLGRAAAVEYAAWRRDPRTHPFARAVVRLLLDAGADRELMHAEAAATHLRLVAYLGAIAEGQNPCA